MKKLIALILLFSTGLFAQDSYTQTLSEFLQVSGVTASHEKIVNELATQFKVPTGTSEYTQLLKDQINALNSSLTPVYKQYVSEEDLKAVTAFFKTPVGQGLVKSQNEIVTKSIPVISEWKSGLKDSLMKSGGDLLRKKLPGFSF